MLNKALQNNDLVGTVTVPPVMAHPGYAKSVDFGNGEQYKTVEEVRYSLGADSAQATFDFVVREGFSREINRLKQNARDIEDTI